MKIQKEISENELLILVGRFYKERNVELIKPYLHSNLIYASAWVEQTLYGTTRFLNYIKPKFATQADKGWNMDFVVLTLTYRNQRFIVLKQNNERDKTVIVGVEFKNGKIWYVHLFPTKAVPHTFIEPSRNFIKAKKIVLSQRMLEYARQLDMKNVLWCISKGADINMRGENGETALTVISKTSPVDSFQSAIWTYHLSLLTKNDGLVQKIKAMEVKLKAAGYFKEMDSVQDWKEYFAHSDISHKLLDGYARRILNLPVARRIEMMKKLIERGARIDDLNLSEQKLARNALYYAVQRREPELVEFLLQNGSNPDFKYPGMNESLLQLATQPLAAEEVAGEDFILRDGKDIEMQRMEIESLKKIVALLERPR